MCMLITICNSWINKIIKNIDGKQFEFNPINFIFACHHIFNFRWLSNYIIYQYFNFIIHSKLQLVCNWNIMLFVKRMDIAAESSFKCSFLFTKFIHLRNVTPTVVVVVIVALNFRLSFTFTLTKKLI